MWRLCAIFFRRSCFAPFQSGNGFGLACVLHDNLSFLFCAFVKRICSFSINSDYARINCLSCNLLNSFSIMFSPLLLYFGFFHSAPACLLQLPHIAMLRRLTNGNANTIWIGFAAISGNIVCGVALVRRHFNVLHSQRDAIRDDGKNKQRQGWRRTYKDRHVPGKLTHYPASIHSKLLVHICFICHVAPNTKLSSASKRFLS